MGGKGSGRKPAPANLRILNGIGNQRDSGGRKVALPPRFVREAPEMPDGLTDDEKIMWEAVIPALESLDLLTPAHLGVCWGLCAMYGQARASHRAEMRYGPVVPIGGKDKSVKANPALRETRLAVAEMRKLAIELGCTPVAERAIADLDSPPGDDGSPFGGQRRPYPHNGYGTL